jgi:hypothetical protein
MMHEMIDVIPKPDCWMGQVVFVLSTISLAALNPGNDPSPRFQSEPSPGVP